jgi:soluble lytic murein transglycosylase-like protein
MVMMRSRVALSMIVCILVVFLSPPQARAWGILTIIPTPAILDDPGEGRELRAWVASADVRALARAFENRGLPGELGTVLWDECRRANIDPTLVLAVIEAESAFRPGATNVNTSGTADRGLMQLNDATARMLARNLGRPDYQPEIHSYDPTVNMKLGIYLLGYLNQRYAGDVDKLLTAYNRGEYGLEVYMANRGTARSEYSERVRSFMAGGGNP